MATLSQLLQQEALRFGNKTALQMQRGYRIERWNYNYLREFSERLATYLRRKGSRGETAFSSGLPTCLSG